MIKLTDDDKNTYTTIQCARIAKCSHQTIQRLFDLGILKGYRLPPRNQARRILKASFEAWLASRTK